MIEPAYTTKIKLNHSHSKPSCYTFGRSHADCHHCVHVSAIFIYSVPAKLAHLLQARASALEEFDSIMTDSASSMKADAPLVTSADKTAWWRKRLELDQRMAALLQHLDEDWLGPWKYDATSSLCHALMLMLLVLSVFVLCLQLFGCPGLPIERRSWLMSAFIAMITSCDALLQTALR